jgi:hypothetical protein
METIEIVDEKNVYDDGLFYRLFAEAEFVRWQMSSYSWASINSGDIAPGWVAAARELLKSELTTFSATQRFFADFGGDVDFTQWLTVWLYEETKHPSVILKWLDCLGHKFDSGFMLQGRETLPFMPERMGTLAANIISEMVAATVYLTLSRQPSIDPVLQQIFRNIGGDEARHAASFYSYAKKRLSRSTQPRQEMRQGLQVLSFWTTPDLNPRVAHPVNMLANRIRAMPEVQPAVPREALESAVEITYKRAIRLFGTLFSLPLKDRQDLSEQLSMLSEPAAGVTEYV